MLWIDIVEWCARLILLGMIGLSVWSVGIILERKKFFKNWKSLMSNIDFKNANYKSDNNDPRYVFIKEIEKVSISSFDNIFKAFSNEKQKEWGRGIPVLGTLGSITPFIGLLGTILGIIVSFGELSKGATDMKGVMFSLAEALILTAVGLGVAIPAVVAFNFFNKKIQDMISDIESIKESYKADQREKNAK